MPKGVVGIKVKGHLFHLYDTYKTRAAAQRKGNELMRTKSWLYHIRKSKIGYALYVS